jgi:hypothetical protein
VKDALSGIVRWLMRMDGDTGAYYRLNARW